MCATSYKAWRRRQIAYGRWQARVPAGPVREHIAALRKAGLLSAHIAELASVSRGTIFNLTETDREQVSAKVAKAVLAVQIPERPADVVPGNALVPMHGARRRFQALIANGYPQADLARELDWDPRHVTIAEMVGRVGQHHHGQSITAERDRAIKALFDRLQMIPGPSERAREYGRAKGWALPLEWDEDALDDPAGKPQRSRWTPASSRAERREQIAELTEAGRPAWQIAAQLGINRRSVERARQLVPAGATERPQMDWGLDR